MFERPGRLTDYITGPYKSEQEARFANNGAYPPDLSLIVLARKGGEDYIFHLLTNYTDTPAGVKIAEGQAYNPYFPGGAIGMPQVIYDGVSCLQWNEKSQNNHIKQKKQQHALLIIPSII